MSKRISTLFALVAILIVAAAGCGSNSVSAPVVDTVAPAPLLDVTVTVVTGGVQVDWSAGTEADLAGYKVYRSENGSVPALVSTVTGVTYTDVTVSSGGYRYEVAAIDQAGNEGVRVASASVRIGATTGLTRRGSID